MKFEKRQAGEGGSYRKVGIFQAKVLAVNPTREQLNKLLGKDATDDQKEIEYLSSKDDKNHISITFWVEDVLTKWKTKVEFDITNEEASTKNGSPIWINQLGDNAKVAKENLQKWFMEFYKSKEDKTVIGEKNFKRALSGEAQLYEFLRAWMSGKGSDGQSINWFSPTTDIFLDRKKLFRNNMSEINDLLNAPAEENITSTVILAAWVDSYEKDGELKYAQKIWQYKFVPGYMMKKINLTIATDSWDSSADTKKIKDAYLGEYGIKGSFYLGVLKEFSAEEHLAATNEVIKHDSTTPSDTDY